MSVQFITHNGKKILFVDSRNSDAKTSMENVKTSTDLALAEADRSVLLLLDVTKAKFDRTLIEQIKTTMEKTRHKIKRSATVGLNPVQAILFNIFVKKEEKNVRRSFDSLETAKSWLTLD